MGNTSKATVTLITHRCSPYSQRVHVALMEKGISFESTFIDYINKPKLLSEANPIWKKVPVLVHDEKTVAESLIILEYIEDMWPDLAPLMPKGAYEKSKVRFWADYLHKEMTAFSDYAKVPSDAPHKQAGRDATIKFIRTLNEAMDSYSTEGPFFTGDQFGFLDVALAPFAGALPVVEAADGLVIPGLDETPRFLKWIDAVRARPTVSVNLPSAEEYFVFLKSLAALSP